MKKVFNVAIVELKKTLSSAKMLAIPMLILVIRNVAILPLIKRTQKMGVNMNFFEPLIAVGNSGVLVLLLPAVFLMVASDFPDIKGNTLSYISRIGRRAWLVGQILYSAVLIIAYLLMVFAGTLLFSLKKSDIGLSWSRATREYISVNPQESNSFIVRLLPPNLYNQMSVPKALIYTFSLLFLYLFTLMLVKLLFYCFGKKAEGLFASYVIVLLGTVTTSIKIKMMWAFPMANSIIWLHFTEILRKPTVPIYRSYLYFLILDAVLIAICMKAVKKTNFSLLK